MTADWCITCKVNEKAVLHTEAFSRLLADTNTVYMVGDWTNEDPAISAFLDEYKAPRRAAVRGLSGAGRTGRETAAGVVGPDHARRPDARGAGMTRRDGLLVVAAALVAGALGVVASLVLTGPGPLLRSETGRQILGAMADEPVGLAVIRPGQPVPPMPLPMLQGAPGPIPAPRPAAVLINYWASWCGPCREEMPVLADFAGQQGAQRRSQVVGIALDGEADARAFLREVPVPFRIALETPGPGDSSVRLGNKLGRPAL